MSNVLIEAAAAETAAIEAATEDFENIAIRLAKGENHPTLQEVQAVMAATDKSAHDLTQRVGYHETRHWDRQTIEAAAGTRKERADLESQVAIANEILEAAKESHSGARFFPSRFD